MNYENGKIDEKEYSNIWISIPKDKQLLIENISYENIHEILKSEFKNNDMVLRIKNKRFKIHPYGKTDNEKIIEYTAEVLEVYKGKIVNEIHYFRSMETNDSFYPDGSKEEVIFLKKYDGKYFVDIFLRFPAVKKIKKMLKHL